MDTDIRPPRGPRASSPTAFDANTNNDYQPPSETEKFQTPEQVAADQAITPTPEASYQSSAEPPQPVVSPPRDFRQRLAAHWPPTWPPTKKGWLIIAGVMVLIAALVAVFVITRPEKPIPLPVVKKIVKPVVSKTVASTLSGIQVDPSTNARPVTAVMIENSLNARPQSGLSESKVVFEAVAEGGITRFMALYQDTAPGDIGPIRSARPYYIKWAMGFDASYAHVGGSPEALADIRALGVKDLDQFANSGAYHRVGSRPAPHNVYSSMTALNQLEAAKGFTSTFKGFVRKKPAPVKVPTARAIDIAISGPSYNVHYDYDITTNTYHRSQAGAGHFDANGNKLITPDVVVVMVMPYGLASDGKHSQYGTIGTGQALIFQDGILTSGQWTKPNEASQILFTDAAGKPIGLNPGQTWLTAVGNAANVTSAP